MDVECLPATPAPNAHAMDIGPVWQNAITETSLTAAVVPLDPWRCYIPAAQKNTGGVYTFKINVRPRQGVDITYSASTQLALTLFDISNVVFPNFNYNQVYHYPIEATETAAAFTFEPF